MRDALGLALIIGIVLTLVGAGMAFAELAFTVLGLAVVIVVVLLIFNLTDLRAVLLPVITAALVLSFIPALVAPFIRHVWQSLSWLTVVFVALLLVVIAFLISGTKR